MNSHHPGCPELELMLRCARNWPDEIADARIRELLAGPVEWEFLLTISERHLMVPFLHWHLRGIEGNAVPRDIRSRLEKTFVANARANMLAFGRLVRLVRLLEGEGIPVIAFKGPLSTYMVYCTPGLRSFADLDILIPPESFSRASHILRAQGFHLPTPLAPSQERALVKFRHEVMFDSWERPLRLDVHWRLLHPCYSMDNDAEIWDRSRLVQLEGHPIRTLAAEDLLYYLCMRSAIDSWSHVYRMVDIAVAVRAFGPASLRAALGLSTGAGTLRALLIGLLQVRELFGIDLLELTGFQNVHDRAASDIARRAWKSLHRAPHTEPGLLRRTIASARALQGVRRIVCAVFWLPLSPGPHDLKILSLPAPLFSLYRLVRLIRLAIRRLLPAARGERGPQR